MPYVNPIQNRRERAAKEAERRARLREDDPFRLRSIKYLYHIRGKPCLVCGSPGEAHHIQYAQPRALGRKTGDQFSIPLCHTCHMKLHNDGMPERTWWALRGIDPVIWSIRTYEAWSNQHGDGTV